MYFLSRNIGNSSLRARKQRREKQANCYKNDDYVVSTQYVYLILKYFLLK